MKSARAPLGCVLGYLILSLLSGVRTPSAQCVHIETIVSPDSSNNSGSVFLGEALGQTFVADETLIESITVWRVAWQANRVYGMRIYVLPVDSLGVPDANNVILTGPTVFHTDGDGVSPTAFEWAFDPPLSLPRPGTYEFAVQSDPCYGIWDILSVDGRTNGRDDYPSGYAWAHSRSDEPCFLRSQPDPYPATDLCFKIRYSGGITPIRQSSWGQIKVLYR